MPIAPEYTFKEELHTQSFKLEEISYGIRLNKIKTKKFTLLQLGRDNF